MTMSCIWVVFEKHPLEDSCQEAIPLPSTTFDRFPVVVRSGYPLPTCGRRRIPVFLRVVSVVWAPHQAPIRIKASDVSLSHQTSAPGTVGAPENHPFPTMSTRLLRTDVMASLWVPFLSGSRQRRRQTPQSGRGPSGRGEVRTNQMGWLSTTFQTR